MPLHFNWMAVATAAAVGMMVPALWYAPKLFGAAWMRLSGLDAASAKPAAADYALAALVNLLMAFALAGFLNYTRSQTFVQGALAGAQFWAGFSLPLMLMDYRFSKRSWSLAFINAGHGAVSLALMGGLLAAWQ